MPSWELFDEQDESYRLEVFPRGMKTLAIEAGVSLGWHRYVGQDGAIISVDRFGVSAPGPLALAHLGFTVENVVASAAALLD